MSDPTTYLTIFFAALSVSLAAWGLIRINSQLFKGTQEHVEDHDTKDLGFLKLFFPLGQLGAHWIRAMLGQRLKSKLTRVDHLINQAGRPSDILPEELLGMSLVNAIASSLLLFFFSQLLHFPRSLYPVFLIVIALAVSFPFLWIFDCRARRQHAIRKRLPHSLDLLTLGVEAGLDFTVAIQRITDSTKNDPLSHEFSLLLRDIQMGAGRHEALDNFRTRIDMMDVHLFSSALIQADELGSPIGPVLKIQSEVLREKRFQRAEEQAMKAPVKIIFPLALFILPVTGMIFLFPLVMKLNASIGLF